jgi:hypothetical protein
LQEVQCDNRTSLFDPPKKAKSSNLFHSTKGTSYDKITRILFVDTTRVEDKSYVG